MVYYGVIQSCHGHDYVQVYTEAQIKKEWGEYKINYVSLPEKKEPFCEDIHWPIGGSNSSATSIWRLDDIDEAGEFLLREPLGPDSDDPTLVDIAEYAWSIDAEAGCTAEVLAHIGKSAAELEQFDKRREELAHYGVTAEMIYGDVFYERLTCSEWEDLTSEQCNKLGIGKKFADHKEIMQIVNAEFLAAAHEHSDWEGTMSYFLSIVKDNSFPEEYGYLTVAVNDLTDEEVNSLLAEYGDDEYMVCKNGEIIPVEDAEESEGGAA